MQHNQSLLQPDTIVSLKERKKKKLLKNGSLQNAVLKVHLSGSKLTNN
jgi:hypothetical protein